MALVVPVFVFCHKLHVERWKTRLSLISLWGVFSVWMFAVTHNVWLLVALHTFLGAALIQHGILYPRVRKKLWKQEEAGGENRLHE